MNNNTSTPFATVFFLVVVFIGMGLLMYHSYEITMQNGELKQTVSTLETTVTTVQADNAALVSQNEQLQAANSGLSAENTALKTDSEALKSDNARLQAEVASLQTENASLAAANQELQASLETGFAGTQDMLIPVTGSEDPGDSQPSTLLLGLDLWTAVAIGAAALVLLPSGYIIIVLIKDILQKVRILRMMEGSAGKPLPRKARRIVNAHFVS